MNIADVGDPVAIPPRLRDHSDGLDHDLTENIHAFDFHLARNYLASTACSNPVRHCL